MDRVVSRGDFKRQLPAPFSSLQKKDGIRESAQSDLPRIRRSGGAKLLKG